MNARSKGQCPINSAAPADTCQVAGEAESNGLPKPAHPAGDKSRAGGVDEPIRDLVALVNTSPDVYTTSSCSGMPPVLLLLGKHCHIRGKIRVCLCAGPELQGLVLRLVQALTCSCILISEFCSVPSLSKSWLLHWLRAFEYWQA